MVAAPQQKPQQQKPQPTAASRMSLDKLIRGRLQQPIRALLYGVEGIGKSTFGADATKAIFIGSEDGTSQLDVTRFPTPETWEDVFEAMRVLATQEHDFQTLVVDTLDWLEPLVWAYICKRDKKDSVEDYGYGKGYVVALDEWRRFIAGLERLRALKRMNVILLAHCWVKTFKNPEGDDFDRYELKVHAKAAGLVKEWVDAVLFTNYQTFAVENEKTKRVKGVSDGSRLIYTNRTPAYDAKNRYGLPATLPLSWEEFQRAVDAGQPIDPAVLTTEIARKAKMLGPEIEKKAAEFVAEHQGDATELAKLNNRLNVKLDEQDAQLAAAAQSQTAQVSAENQ